ncbi:MAG: adenylate kinase [candidate division WOR-3 bacterium]
MERLRLIFLGPPGAGKGTQAEKLEKEHGILKISTGDILRESVSKGTTLGEIARVYMERGELVPDDIIIGLVREKIIDLDEFVLDGFPRNVNQAEGLDRLLDSLGKRITAAIYFEVPDQEVKRRLLARRVCPECKRIYNIITDPPSEDELCDKCKVKLIIRSDDNEETIENRLKVYHEQTKPLLNYYESRGILIKIDGSGTPEQVYRNILEVVKR